MTWDGLFAILKTKVLAAGGGPSGSVTLCAE